MFSKEYEEVLVKLHNEDENWGTSGARYIDDVTRIIDEYDVEWVLDVGCGKGNLVTALSSLYPEKQILGYDPFYEPYSEVPCEQADLIVCTDVLEHIEPEHLDDFIKFMIGFKPEKLYLAISLVSAKQILPDGRNAHLIVKPTEWWIDTLRKHVGDVTIVSQTPSELRVICG